MPDLPSLLPYGFLLLLNLIVIERFARALRILTRAPNWPKAPVTVDSLVVDRVEREQSNGVVTRSYYEAVGHYHFKVGSQTIRDVARGSAATKEEAVTLCESRMESIRHDPDKPAVLSRGNASDTLTVALWGLAFGTLNSVGFMMLHTEGFSLFPAGAY